MKSISTSFLDKLNTFFGLLGGAVGAGRGTWIPVVVGLGLFSWIAGLALSVLKRQRVPSISELFYLSLFAWVVLTACAIALNRSGGSNTSLSRYKVYPMLTLVIFYLLTLERLPSPRRVWLLRGTLLGAIPFWALTQLRMPALLTAHRHILLTDAFNFRNSGTSINPTYLANRFQPYPYLKQARAAGVYEYPSSFYSPFETRLLQPLSAVAQPFELAMDSTSQPGLWTLHHADVEVPGDSPDDGVYLVLQSSSNTYLFPTLPDRPLYGIRAGPSQGFTATLAPKALRRGQYRIGLYTYHRGNHTLVSTTTKLQI